MRAAPQLSRDPDIHPVTMSVLVGVADTIERESVRHYEALAALMERRGEAATAAAFHVMLEEERRHVDLVSRWSASIGEAVPASARFEWRLPADLSSSWDEIVGSARLTPYRAFAIAVDNEQRAFALYSYLASAAVEPRVAEQAEWLARDELRHAALMRRWRRQAYHRERRGPGEPAPADLSLRSLHDLLQEREAVIAARHRAIAARLRALGDGESADLLEALATQPSPTIDSGAVASAEGLSDDPVHLLVAAQEPLEALSETLEELMRTLEGERFDEAERALGNVIRRLARIALQTARRMDLAPMGAKADPG